MIIETLCIQLFPVQLFIPPSDFSNFALILRKINIK